MSDRALRALPPVVAGRYEPVAKIASGGMATVYLAKARAGAGFEKMVALKCVHPHMADRPEFVAMFLDEARIAARIDHPNVCHVFDAGEDDGTHYIAMEYLHGESVGSLMKAWSQGEAPDPDTRIAIAARVIADAAMGLYAAHELRGSDGKRLGLVHRDVSPQNLFVTYSGSVKVVDFGIAKAEGRLYETTTGVVRGKLAYMSPEQACAETLDHRSDIWSLGVTLWELLTLRRLFRRDDRMATLNAVLEGPIVPPSHFEPSLPAALDRVVLDALRRSPTERYETARALADALNVFLASRGAPIGMAELSDHMAATFPTRIAEKEAVTRLAEATPSAVRISDASRTRPLDEPAAIEALRGPATETAVVLPVEKTGRWVLLGLALVAGLAGGAFIWVSSSSQSGVEEPPSAGSGVPPAASAEPSSSDESSSPVVEAAVVEAAVVEAAVVEAAVVEAAPVSDNAPVVPTRRHRRRAAEPSVPASAVPSSVAASASPRPVRVVHPSGGWAAFRFDGATQRSTPTTVAGVRPGRHTVEVQPYGQGAWVRSSVDVPAGSGPHIVRISLPPPSE